jgi:hypothetical protein
MTLVPRKPTANVLIATSITIATKIVNGSLVTSANVTLQPAQQTGTQFAAVGGAEVLSLANLAQLPPNLQPVSAQLAAATGALETAIDAVNAILKLA